MQDRIYDMLLKEDEITWQNIIYDLIKTEQMNPWNIDISLLANKYIETVQRLKEANFFISGKVILASALLLRIKADKFLTEDIAGFDSFLFKSNEGEQLDDFIDDDQIREEVKIPKLAIKTPLARKRKVSVNDLIEALQRALEVNKRKVLRRLEERANVNLAVPERKVDITKLIRDVYEKILDFFKVKEKVTFNELVMSDKKEDRIMTFIPLLHLDNQLKIDLQQKEHFGEIEIRKLK